MPTELQLKWIQQNRTRRRRAWQTHERRLGDVLGALARGPELSGGEISPEAVAAVAAVVDQEFVNHCRIASSRNGAMLVCVDNAALVYPLRLRWLDALSVALCGRNLRRPMTRVVFKHGQTGVRITDPQCQQR